MLINASSKNNNSSKTDVCHSILFGLDNDSRDNYVGGQMVKIIVLWLVLPLNINL